MKRKNRKISDVKPPWFDANAHIRRKAVWFFVNILAWTGMAVMLYAGFSLLFDTPMEYHIKQANKQLQQEYDRLDARYDTIYSVLENVVERDRSIFIALFEAEPYGRDTDKQSYWQRHEQLISQSTRELTNLFTARSTGISKLMDELENSFGAILARADTTIDATAGIPSIQPVVNTDLTLLTSSFGLRINPFYKLLTQHNGVDFSVPTGTRIFATADGTVRNISSRTAVGGLTLTLGHAGGYVTTYAHLDKVLVTNGQRVKRGDIIALSGDTGQSLSPHLHYEISLNGMRVDPVHYFFMELSPGEYHRLMQIAESGMQSFD